MHACRVPEWVGPHPRRRVGEVGGGVGGHGHGHPVHASVHVGSRAHLHHSPPGYVYVLVLPEQSEALKAKPQHVFIGVHAGHTEEQRSVTGGNLDKGVRDEAGCVLDRHLDSRGQMPRGAYVLQGSDGHGYGLRDPAGLPGSRHGGNDLKSLRDPSRRHIHPGVDGDDTEACGKLCGRGPLLALTARLHPGDDDVVVRAECSLASQDVHP
mmetsp:Transcript_284/g.830  ORF Transcript_284/g.830 Transcript_284/m.830 type:complete len:210 (-) Transcript_284:2546-3175(-)